MIAVNHKSNFHNWSQLIREITTKQLAHLLTQNATSLGRKEVLLIPLCRYISDHNSVTHFSVKSDIIFFIISSFAPKILTSKGVRINQQTKSKKMLQKVYLNVLFRTFDINYILGKAKTLIYLDCVYDNNLCECNHCDVQPIGAHKCQYLSY